MAQLNHNQPLVLTDGEKLSILINRDGRLVKDLASVWGKDRRTLTRYMTEKKLPQVVIKRACEVLGVSESVFDARLDADHLLRELEEMHRAIESLNHRVHVLEAEKSGLSDAIKILKGHPNKEAGN